MTTRFGRILSMVWVAAPLLLAQDGRLAGPLSGFVFDSSGHALRPVRGIPGASTIGDPMDFGFDVMSVEVAPRLDSAVVVASDSSLHFFRLTSGAAAERAIDGFSGAPERVVFSPSGTAVALYATGRVRIVKGLPDSPVMAGTLDLGDVPKSLAISDDGAYLLLTTGNTVRLIGAAGENFKVMDAADGALVAFAPGGHDAAVSDSRATLVWFRDLTGSSQRTALTAGDDSMNSPVGLAFSADGRNLFVASATGSVSSFELQSGNRSSVQCNCTPTRLIRMGNAFRLNELGPEPLWLLDAAAAEPRIVFVPALPQPDVKRPRPPIRSRAPAGQ